MDLRAKIGLGRFSGDTNRELIDVLRVDQDSLWSLRPAERNRLRCFRALRPIDECESQDWQNLVFMFSGGRCLVLWRDVDQFDKNRNRGLIGLAFDICFRSLMDCSSFLPFRLHLPRPSAEPIDCASLFHNTRFPFDYSNPSVFLWHQMGVQFPLLCPWRCAIPRLYRMVDHACSV